MKYVDAKNESFQDPSDGVSGSAHASTDTTAKAVPRGWGVSLFSYIRRLGSFFGFKILNLNIFGIFQKNEYFSV